MQYSDRIVVQEAFENNLKGLELEIKKGLLHVITGPSGAGKRSLAINTLYSMGLFTLHKLFPDLKFSFSGKGGLYKPKVGVIRGLPPVVCVSLKRFKKKDETLAESLGIYSLLEAIVKQAGVEVCKQCKSEINRCKPKEIIDFILELKKELPRISNILITCLFKNSEEDQRKAASKLLELGHSKILAHNKTYEVNSVEEISSPTFEIIVDELYPDETFEKLVKQAITFALDQKCAALVVRSIERSFKEIISGPHMLTSPTGICPNCLTHPPSSHTQNDLLECFFLEIGSYAKRISLKELLGFDCKKLQGAIKGIKYLSAKLSPYFEELKNILFLVSNIRLDYIPLNRGVSSLSRGELMKLTILLGILRSRNRFLYIFEDPTSGLDPASIKRAVQLMRSLKKAGNTVVAVSNERELIKAADNVIELGPGSGSLGGEIVAISPPNEIEFFSDENVRVAPLRVFPRGKLVIKGARRNNLKNLSFSLPLGVFTIVTGPSGSGKSSLVIQSLYPALRALIAAKRTRKEPSLVELKDFCLDDLTGYEGLKKVEALWVLEKSKAPSSVASFLGFQKEIASLFCMLPLSKQRGFDRSYFLPTSKKSRCLKCSNSPFGVEIEPCGECKGKGWSKDLLDIKLRGLSIAQVYSLTIRDLGIRFGNLLRDQNLFQVLRYLEVDYLSISQPVSSLSLGELQRLRLAVKIDLSKRNIIYLLDEPSAGLSQNETINLISVFQRLIKESNTIVAIEHNSLFAKAANCIITLGKGAGSAGGEIISYTTAYSRQPDG